MKKKTKVQREVEKIYSKRLSMGRNELAKRYPEYKGEIKSGTWDQSAAMITVLRDLAVLSGKL